MTERVSDERAAELKRDVEDSVATAQRGVRCQASWGRGCCDADDALLLLADRADRKAWIAKAEEAMYAILECFPFDGGRGVYHDHEAQRIKLLLDEIREAEPMPQASDEQRARWPGWDTQAIEYLERQGWTHTDGYEWIPPIHIERALDAIGFLVNEFDWGGIAEDEGR